MKVVYVTPGGAYEAAVAVVEVRVKVPVTSNRPATRLSGLIIAATA